VRVFRVRSSWLALLVLGAFLGLYAGFAQERLFGDGSRLVNGFSWPLGERPWEFAHVLYPVLSRGFYALPFVSTPAEAMTWLSVVSGALGLALVFLALVRFGSPRAEALLLTAMAGTSPLLLFFSTTIEVHAPHFFTVALALFVLSCGARVFCVGTFVGLVFLIPVELSHKTGVLLTPAFVAVLWGRLWARGDWNARRAVWLAGGVSLAFLFALVLAAHLRGQTVWAEVANDGRHVGHYWTVMGPRGYFEMWVQPLGFLWVIPVWILFSSGWRHPRSGLVLLGVLPAAVFFSAFGVVERGAYGVGILIFLLVAVAMRERLVSTPRPLPGFLWLVLLLQVVLGVASVRSFDDGTWGPRLDERARTVEAALPEGGALLTVDPDQQTISKSLPAIIELNLATPLSMATQAHADLEGSVEAALAAIAPLANMGAQHLALEVQPSANRLPPGWPAYIEALQKALDETYSREQAEGLLRSWTLEPGMNSW